MARRGADRGPVTAALPLRLFAPTPAIAEPGGAPGLLAAAFDAVPNLMALVDAEGKLQAINPAGRRLLASARLGEHLSQAIAPDNRIAFEALLAQTFAGKPAYTEVLRSESGLALEITAHSLAYDHDTYVLVSGRNIEGERKLRESAEMAARLQTVGLMAGGLAHDLNNVLAVVIANSELLGEKTGNDREARELLDVSLAAARTGVDLAGLLLALASSRRASPAEFCAADCLHDWRGLIERGLGPGIALEIACDEEPWSVRADRAQLANVLLNLALNARDAMAESGNLRLEARNIRAGGIDAIAGDAVMIAVCDSGSGIPPAILQRVFEPFFTTKKTGTGLGLAMAREFADRAGGYIDIESAPRQGTTVRLYLPRVHTQLGLPLSK